MPLHRLPELDYDFGALEPFIDAKTMRIHYTKHHQAYVDKLNLALQTVPELMSLKPEELLRDLAKIPVEQRTAIRNHGGAHYNHSLFWKFLNPHSPFNGEIKTILEKQFGSLDEFKKQFKGAALAHFGSGWVWLVLDHESLMILSTPNQDNPISQNKIPLLGLDLWEHAYYLNYQNNRDVYIDAFFNIINWDQVNENLVVGKLQIFTS